ncbi:G2 M phase-specific E3 ubiquitin- ligase-like [Paramuricea clavata]|uniref:G2 M phase-specific E3 ubiquitin- ligase-like n=1 Tax=Paramuricea clavata TaxID=317549 RepID=A0A6S7GCV4_PARCT|nr:G2 M phase-specific E3 ubiquitin- ligase-like [Paramuricea clavata]
MNCLKDIPIQDMKSHVEDCCSEVSSKHEKCGSSLSKPSSSIDLTRLSEEIWGEPEESEMKDEKLWEKDLELMFPSSSIESMKKAIGKAISLNEAAELLLEDATPKEEHPQDPVTYDSIESLVADFSSSVNDNKSYTLCIDREELWRGALSFYKKALSDKTLPLKDLSIIFKGEEGLDAGAMKVEYFELLLTEIHQRLLKDHNHQSFPFVIALKVFY